MVYTFNLNRITDPTTILEYGETYTIEIVTAIGFSTKFRTINTGVVPSPFGVSYFGGTFYIDLSVNVDHSQPPLLQVADNLNVGIGVDTPTAALHVNGRIKDATGFVMPVGSIIPYAGATEPEGWLFCDGLPKSRVDFSDLFNAIGTAWGQGDSVNTFNLPDLRGMFLRGVDSTANGVSASPWDDPDRNSRIYRHQGGNTGGAVGSYQEDTLERHLHPIPWTLNQTGTNPGLNGNYGVSNGTISSGNTAKFYTGGAETRPKNVYVNYIIKY